MGNVSLCYRPVARVRSDARKSQRHFVSLGDLGGRMLKEIADSQQQQDSSSSGDEDSRDSQQQQDRKGAAGQHRDTEAVIEEYAEEFLYDYPARFLSTGAGHQYGADWIVSHDTSDEHSIGLGFYINFANEDELVFDRIEDQRISQTAPIDSSQPRRTAPRLTLSAGAAAAAAAAARTAPRLTKLLKCTPDDEDDEETLSERRAAVDAVLTRIHAVAGRAEDTSRIPSIEAAQTIRDATEVCSEALDGWFNEGDYMWFNEQTMFPEDVKFPQNVWDVCKASSVVCAAHDPLRNEFSEEVLDRTDRKLGWVFHMLALVVCREVDEMHNSYFPAGQFSLRMETLVVFICACEEIVKRLKKTAGSSSIDESDPNSVASCIRNAITEACEGVKKYLQDDVQDHPEIWRNWVALFLATAHTQNCSEVLGEFRHMGVVSESAAEEIQEG